MFKFNNKDMRIMCKIFSKVINISSFLNVKPEKF